jgi:phosphohistidine swiveling domain-containing protein
MEEAEKVELELMWEAVESFYFAYANGWSYIQKLDGWHPYAERTHLLDFKGRSVRAYLDRKEMIKASKAALPNFLDEAWIARFEQHSRALIEEAEAFTDSYHLRSEGLDRAALNERLTQGTKLLYDALLAFMVTQPQYSWELEPHIFSLLPNMSSEEKQHVLATLAQSTEQSFLTEEELAWAKLVQGVKEEYPALPGAPDEDLFSKLDEYARRYGLICAADGQAPWDRTSLFARLTTDWDKSLVTDKDEETKRLIEEQEELIRTYNLSDGVVRVCRSLGLLSHLRLETRLRGWMPLEYVVVHELIPQLTRFLPYTKDQLESCTPDELTALLQGANGPTAAELDERAKHVVAGIYKGEEVLWVGKEAEERMAPLLPVIDYEAKELIGQPAMKGKVTGRCHVISWEVDMSAQQIDEMPEGAILVAGQTRPQLMGAIKKAAAIITDEGGVLSHAAIVSRELRIPCIIGTKYGTKILKTGDMVEVDADAGVVRKK